MEPLIAMIFLDVYQTTEFYHVSVLERMQDLNLKQVIFLETYQFGVKK
jgi:hypothetical protein